MSAEGERTLVSTRRWVNARRNDDYAAAWERVRVAVEARGAHAWRFVSRSRSGLQLEFIEFATGADPRRSRDTRDALAALDRAHPHLASGGGAAEEWTEVRPPPDDGQS
ncbi:hypothetical protein BH20GEM2_BH20GEM2_07790 [soil metagenome]